MTVIAWACATLRRSQSGSRARAFTITSSLVEVRSSGRCNANADARRTHAGITAVSSLCASHGSDSTFGQESTPDEDGMLDRLCDQTLLSVEHCVRISAFHREQRGTSPPPGDSTRRSRSNVVFVDGSWYHRPDPATGLPRDPAREHARGPRLPRARYLDIDAVAATRALFPGRNPTGLPHMMPPPRLFGLTMDAYGIRADDRVVVYARRGALFTPRVWFLFVGMGHAPERVHLMQGSLEDYAEEGGALDTRSLLAEDNDLEEGVGDRPWADLGGNYVDCFDQGILNVTRLYHTHYSTATPQYKVTVPHATNICAKEEVMEAVHYHLEGGNAAEQSGAASNTVILDTRGSGYAKNGHMPSAIHLPYTEIATATNALALRPVAGLRTLFEERGIAYLDPDLKIILSCGSGVSVCHAYLALKELGRNITEDNTRIYDGSWKEWGREETLPKILPDEMI